MVRPEQRQPLGKRLEAELSREVGAKEARKLRARREKHRTVWFGLGMFGLVGWSVAMPTVAGIALGIWIDSRWPSDTSWTLTLLVLGVALGCVNAWFWVSREREKITSPEDEEGEDE
jgi:ATP synthase protein I